MHQLVSEFLGDIQVHAVPDIETRVKPVGRFSVTVTVPWSGPRPGC